MSMIYNLFSIKNNSRQIFKTNQLVTWYWFNLFLENFRPTPLIVGYQYKYTKILPIFRE